MLRRMARVSSLHLYPVKSLRGIDVAEVRVEKRGFANDRRFMVVDDKGIFTTQRESPRMATISTALEGDRLTLCHGGNSVSVPLAEEGERLRVRVWRSAVDAIHVAGADAFLSWALGASSRLVRMPESSHRETNPEFSQPGDHVSFADGYPVLLANQASLDDLNLRMAETLPMARFRPNLVIEGGEPWAEDEMALIRMADVSFRNAKPCVRCAVTTLDPVTGENRGPEPLKTLAEFRRWENGVRFGINLIPDAEGNLRVGDEVQSE
ncbi:MOSC domain-containing protein [soil metagenome]